MPSLAVSDLRGVATNVKKRASYSIQELAIGRRYCVDMSIFDLVMPGQRTNLFLNFGTNGGVAIVSSDIKYALVSHSIPNVI